MLSYSYWTTVLIAEASRSIWVMLDKARRRSRIAYASGVDDVGEWCSIDDPNIGEADAPKLAMGEMIVRLSVPILTDIFNEPESFVCTSAHVMRIRL